MIKNQDNLQLIDIERLMKSDIAKNLKGKDFLKLLDFSTEEILHLIDLAQEIKVSKKQGVPHK